MGSYCWNGTASVECGVKMQSVNTAGLGTTLTFSLFGASTAGAVNFAMPNGISLNGTQIVDGAGNHFLANSSSIYGDVSHGSGLGFFSSGHANFYNINTLNVGGTDGVTKTCTAYPTVVGGIVTGC
jgi:hypothetical protein